MPKGHVCIEPDMLARCEGTIMRMATAHKIHPGAEPVILHLSTKHWRLLRAKAMKCPYTPRDVKRHLALARKVFIARNTSRRYRAQKRERAQRTKTASSATPHTFRPESICMYPCIEPHVVSPHEFRSK